MSRTSQLFARVILGSCLSVVLASSLVWGADAVATSAPSTGDVLKYEAASGDTFLAIGLRDREMSDESVASIPQSRRSSSSDWRSRGKNRTLFLTSFKYRRISRE